MNFIKFNPKTPNKNLNHAMTEAHNMVPTVIWMKFVKAIIVDFWIGKVDCSHGSGLLIVPVLGPVHTEIYAPCIMCVQYRGGAQYRGGVQYRGGYHKYRGGISWVPWGCSVPWGISWVPWGLSWVPWGMFSTVGDIMMHVGDIMMHVGDIMSTVEGVQYRGGIFCYLSTPRYWTPPTVLMISPTCIMISPTVLKFQRMVSPTVLNTPRHPWYPPTCIMISSMVLNIPHGTQDTPTVLMISPTVLNTPMVLKISPHLSWYPPQYWTPPRYSKYPPRYSWYPPTVLNTPRYWVPPTVLHTHYTGWDAVVSFPNISRQTSKGKSDMSANFKHCRMRSNLYLKFNKQLRKLMESFVFKFVE